MSQDIISDGLNAIMNAKRAGESTLTLEHHSKLLISILALAKLKGYVKDYKIDGRKVSITLGKLNLCKALKPRYTVDISSFSKYEKRYLPARNFGIIIVSTSKGLMTHQTAIEKNLGGSLIAYMY